MRRGRIDIITMGCSKNLIDSERLICRLEEKGYEAVHNSEEPTGEIVVVNTCGFIGDAKEESINLILKLCSLKNQGDIGKLIIMGCLSERYRKELPEEIPEVDEWYGKFDWKDLLEKLPSAEKETTASDTEKAQKKPDWERKLTTPPWSAYIKVSEGCDRFCAYCAIPLITGRHKSRPIEEILEETKSLVKRGVKEFNIIAQDLSSYGIDLYGEQTLPELIDSMASIEGVEWIRLHYLYPTDFPYGILEVIRRNDNVCKYLDIALQHVSDNVLQGMNRKITKQETLQLLERIRKEVPGIHIRTTIMTGFPGEDEKAFEELKDFVKTQRFERLGGFAYSEEDDTLAAKTLADNIPQETKEERLSVIMDLQQEISEENNLNQIGKVMNILVEEIHDGYAIGRSEFDSPEVDQEVFIEGSNAQPGTFVKVKITEASPFELRGVEVNRQTV